MNDSQINGAGNRPTGIDGFHTHERECFPGVRANQTDGKCEDILGTPGHLRGGRVVGTQRQTGKRREKCIKQFKKDICQTTKKGSRTDPGPDI